MKVAGLWIALMGYTLGYVGWANITGADLSFVGALRGDTATPKPNGGDSGGILGLLRILANPIGAATSAVTTAAPQTATTAPITGPGALI